MFISKICHKIKNGKKNEKIEETFLVETDCQVPDLFSLGDYIGNVGVTTLFSSFERKGETHLEIRWEDSILLKQIILVNSKNEIIGIQEIAESERNPGVMRMDVSFWKEYVTLKSRCTILARAWDCVAEQDILVEFSSKEIAQKKKENNEPFYHCASYLSPVKVEDVAYLYYQNGKERLSLFVCPTEKVLHEQMQAKLLKMKSGKSKLQVLVQMKRTEGFSIKEVVFRYRSILSYDIPLKFQVNEKGMYDIVTIDFDFAEMNLRELYWDLYVIVDAYGIKNEISVKFPNLLWKRKFYLTNKDYKAGNTHIIFPYYTVANCMAFLYRAASPYDGYDTKLKDMFASVVYMLGKPYWKKKRIWLVFEKFCTMAQDNGYYFFKYCMENLPEDERKHIYFVIDKNSPDYGKVKKYKKQVLPFMSLKHCLYILVASLYVGSDARSHLYAWRSKTSLIRSKMITRPIFFLQHGVTALKDVSKIFGVNGSSAMTYFTATSRFEQEIIVDKLGYKEENSPITGFTRWDVLEDTSSKEDKLILVMPTWRSWLEEVTEEDFLQSEYYKQYAQFLQNLKLAEMLEKYQARMIFYIHPKFASYQKNFKGMGERIELVPFGSRPLNEILKKCHLLITDYSSVCWDVYYQKKPVIFYQFDYDQYQIAHGSFIDMETELFGQRAVEENVLLEYIEACMKSDFSLLAKDEEKHNYYFEYIDDKNSQRTYEYLRGKNY